MNTLSKLLFFNNSRRVGEQSRLMREVPSEMDSDNLKMIKEILSDRTLQRQLMFLKHRNRVLHAAVGYMKQTLGSLGSTSQLPRVEGESTAYNWGTGSAERILEFGV